MSQTFRALDVDGDWAFGQGRGSYLTYSDAISADVRTALQIFLGEVFWRKDFGVDWWNLLGGKAAHARTNIILQSRAIIAQVEGVAKINSVDAQVNSATRRLTLTYSIDTIFSKGATASVTI